MQYKTSVLPCWGWWETAHRYPGDEPTRGQMGFGDAVQRHISEEERGGWSLVNSHHISAASDDFMLFIWAR